MQCRLMVKITFKDNLKVDNNHFADFKCKDSFCFDGRGDLATKIKKVKRQTCPNVFHLRRSWQDKQDGM